MPPTDNADGRPGFASVWFNARRKRFWAIVLVSLYTLVGFVLAPWWARAKLESVATEQLQRPVTLREFRMNPYVLSVEAEGLQVSEDDGTPLLAADRLYANLQLSSVFRRALVFRDIEIDAPGIFVVRDESGAVNLAEPFMNVGAESPPAETDARAAGSLPRVVVGNLAITAGAVNLEDRALETDFETRLGPVDIVVANLSTLPDESGEQQVTIESEGGTRFEWQGSLQISPLLSEGRVSVTGSYLPVIYRYFQDQLNFSVQSGEVEMQFDYRVQLPPDDVLSASIEDLSGRLTGITGRADDRDAEFLRLPDTQLTGGYLSWPERRIGAATLVYRGARLELWRDADGELIFSQLLATPIDEPNPTDEPNPQDEPAAAWDLRVDSLRVDNLGVGFEDHSLTEPGRFEATDIDIDVSGLSNVDDAETKLALAIDLEDRGNLQVDATAILFPEVRASGTLAASGLALAAAQPWVGDVARIRIDDGRLHGGFDAAYDTDSGVEVSGSLHVDELEIHDETQSEKLVGWKKLGIDRLSFNGSRSSIELSDVVFDQLFVRLLIAEDGSTNFSRLPRTDGAGDAEAGVTRADGEDSATSLTIGRIRFNDGQVDFTDLALPFPFEAQVREFHGDVSTLATDSAAPATIDLEGKVGEYGFARVEGNLMPADVTKDTDLHVLFRNVQFPDLSPYTIKFAGRRIDDGRLELDLRYRIEEGQLDAENSIVIERIELGDKVDYPDAMSLPLGLAIALLQDPSGRINIDLPVGGNVNDPEFSVGGVVLRAFVNLITKAATSPFRLLGGLVGADTENFDRIEFESGQADLTPPEREKLDQLAQALAMRPTLNLAIAGAVDRDADAFAMRTARVDGRIDAMLETEQAASDSAMIAERRRNAIEASFRETWPEERLRDLRREFNTPVDPEKPDGEQAFDELAYVARLRDRLIAVEEIGAADLDGLGIARADSVIAHLTSAAEPVGAERVERGETTEAEADERGFVPVKLELLQ